MCVTWLRKGYKHGEWEWCKFVELSMYRKYAEGKHIHPDCEDAEPFCAARGIVVLLDGVSLLDGLQAIHAHPHRED